jgi:8-oxo-dGTP diphosphatase
MPHIHTDPGQHDLTATTFIVRTDKTEPMIMLHMHRKLGKYMPFGGHVELDENPWQTITHELKEEAGYDVAKLKILQPKLRLKDIGDESLLNPVPIYSLTTQYSAGENHYHIDNCYAMAADSEPDGLPGSDESSDLQLFTRDQIAMLPESTIFPSIRIASLFILDELLKEWEFVATEVFSKPVPFEN